MCVYACVPAVKLTIVSINNVNGETGSENLFFLSLLLNNEGTTLTDSFVFPFYYRNTYLTCTLFL